ncbi:ROK family transcriptional regulator [Fusibacter sp. 3D3]|uniref:ROK family transcriptional regulator n=1 Tax=Fusibacter sp. 3D3 TaxID=1048380 RepID=UPI000852ABF4|nr:ROK family transcriptional regulator [Fusibacter sp. 3D3]
MNSKIVIGKPELLKRINRNSIIKLIFKQGNISRSEIAKITKLTLPSVMRIVDGLTEEGLVIDVGKGDSSGGRKPNLICLNRDHLYILGVEIAINTLVVLTDLSGCTIERWESPQMAYDTPTKMLEEINSVITKLIQKYNIPRDKIAGIGIGTPGTNFKHHKSKSYAILKGWESIDVKAWFKDKFDCPVYIDNVARTRTLSELWFGRGREVKHFIYVFVDQGVGCGIVSNSAIYEGANGVAGEFGHSVIEYHGRECYCGNRGCIEMYVSAGAIISEISETLKLNPNKKMTFREVMAYENEDEANAILIKSAKVLSVGIANLINIFNPQMVVIGGIVPINSKVFTNVLFHEVNQSIFSNAAVETEIVLSEIEMSASGLGSVALVVNETFKSVVVAEQG